MDFVTFESFNNMDALPLPQPSLSLPIKSNLDNLGINFSNFNNIKNLWKLNSQESSQLPPLLPLQPLLAQTDSVAQQYASLSLQAIRGSEPAEASSTSLSRGVSDDITSRNLALSKRLARALSLGLSDSEIRNYFSLLESRVPDTASLTDPGPTGSYARKNLRGDVEADLIKAHSQALLEYARVVKNLESVGNRISSLDNLLDDINSILAKDASLGEPIATDVSRLAASKTSLNVKKQLLESFKKAFALNEYESFVLTQGDITPDFFAALSHAEEINSKCLLLLALDNPQLGQSIMSQTSSLINKAMDKLLQFCNRSITNLYLMNDKSRTDTLHMCLVYLKRKHLRFEAVLDAYVESRVPVVLEDFAFQTNAQNDTTEATSKLLAKAPRPVYYTSHDPSRFVSDILAYVHSVVVNETEIVAGLFADDSGEFKETTHTIMTRILSALSRSLRSTIEQLLSQEAKLLLIYHIFCHLDLYRLMFEKLEHAEPLVSTLDKLISASRERVQMVIRNKLATIKSSNQAQMDLSLDLQPPEWIIDFYADLMPMIDSMTTDTIFKFEKEEHEAFINHIIDGPISIFYEHLTVASKSMGKRDTLMFKQNFLDLILSKILPIQLLSDKVIEINHMMHEITMELTSIQLNDLLKQCGLYDYYNIVNMICPLEETFEFFDASMYQSLTENKLFNKEQVSSANQKLQTTLPNALIESQQNLMRLNLPMIVNDVITELLLQFIRFYHCLDAIVKEYLKEPLFTWTDIEIATLLGVEESYSRPE